MKRQLLYSVSLLLLVCALCFGVSAVSRYDRPNYPDDPSITLADGVAYKLYYTGGTGAPFYTVEDLFATNELYKNATEINILPEIDGIPVRAIDSYYAKKAANYTVTSITIPEGIESISGQTLRVLKAVKEIKIPSSVKTLGYQCFQNMTALEKITIPKTVEEWRESVFENCVNLQQVKIKSHHLTAIPYHAFYNCKKLESFTIPSWVTSIGSGAFQKSGITDLGIPSGVSLSSGSRAESIFQSCKNLKTVRFAAWQYDGYEIPPRTFKGCTSLTTVLLPRANHLKIGEYAFAFCTSLTKVTGCEYIDTALKGAFYKCENLQRFEIGNRADRIGSDTFKGCSGLKKLVLRTDNIQLFDVPYPAYDRNYSGNFLRYVPKTCKVYVPNDAMQQSVLAHGFKGKVIVKEMPDLETIQYG